MHRPRPGASGLVKARCISYASKRSVRCDSFRRKETTMSVTCSNDAGQKPHHFWVCLAPINTIYTRTNALGTQIYEYCPLKVRTCKHHNVMCAGLDLGACLDIPVGLSCSSSRLHVDGSFLKRRAQIFYPRPELSAVALSKCKVAESMEVIDAICQVCGARSRTRTWFCRQKNPYRMGASKY